VRKDSPSVSAVHVSSALGGSDAPKKRKDFLAFIGEGKPKVVYPEEDGPTVNADDASVEKIYSGIKDLPKAVKDKIKGKKRRRQWMHVFNSEFKTHGDEARAFAGAWSTVQKKDKTWSLTQPLHGDGPGGEVLSAPPMIGVGGRRLEPFDDGTLHIPFLYDPTALAYLREDQVPRVLDAITHPKRLPLATTRLDSLVAVKSRVGRETVQKHLDNLDDVKPPVVAIINDVAYILDGHDRLAAMWLNGDDECDVYCEDVGPFDYRKPDPDVKHEGSRYDLLAGEKGRQLVDYRSDTLAIPFLYDQAFFSHLRPDQVPKFLSAITHADDLEDAVVSMDSLVAIQNRVNADTVAARVEKPSKKPPVITRINGRNYIGDGHDRLAAAWLAGADEAPVKLVDITWADNAMKPEILRKRLVNIEVKKVDKDKMQVFGWASVVNKGGEPVIDLQDEIIPIEELEPAVYEYVLNSRDGGDMHEDMGVSKCIESMMFTTEKQKALGIDLGQEGWWIGLQYHDPKLWKKVKAGERPAFSIGGVAASKDL
jgi:hypothetical protein